MAKKKKEVGNSSDFVKLGSSLGGILLVVVLFVLIFSPTYTSNIIANVVWGFVVLGAILGFLQYLNHRSKKK